MNHMFDVEVAKEVGIVAAILFQNLGFWCLHNKANRINYHDGHYWTYNTITAYCELFPYMTEKVIRTGLQKLIDADLIITGNYNTDKRDRTTWYALTEKGDCIFLNGKLQFPDWTNASSQNGEALPYIKPTDINADINSDKSIVATRSASRRFTPPTVDEVKAYCLERNNNVDAERFCDYYSANGWTQGKGKPIRDWKACVRLWEKSNYNDNAKHKRVGPNGIALSDEPYEEIIPGFL